MSEPSEVGASAKTFDGDWVKCDDQKCGKWRKLPLAVFDALDDGTLW